ncbi:hypothetical protein F4810DRAFT_656308 [Camillea tinctor]|nr:hypothetical protein F4810DRAFT_656308 [Camillea tinctor]
MLFEEAIEYPISKSAQKCNDHFKDLVKIMLERDILPYPFQSRETILNHQQSFEFWVGSTAVFHEPLIRLDTRLRNNPDLRNLVLEELQLVDDSLQSVINFESARQRRVLRLLRVFGYHKRFVSLTRRSQDALDDVKVGIKGLNNLSTSTDRFSFDYLYSNYLYSIPIKNIGMEVTDDRDALLERTAILFVRNLLPKICDALAIQLAESVVYRTRRILYQQRQQGGGSSQYRILQELRSKAFSSSSSPPAPSSSLFDESGGSSKGPPRVLYSHLPEPHEDSELENPSSWKAHTWRDLEPYVCISEECGYPTPSFKSYREWQQHMVESHTKKWPQQVYLTPIWYCNLDHSELSEFDSPCALEMHIESEHNQRFPSGRLAWIFKHDVLSRPRKLGTCPLCDWYLDLYPEDSKGKVSKAFEDNDNISDGDLTACQPKAAANSSIDTSLNVLDVVSKHVSGHFEPLALFSLRYLEDYARSMGPNSSTGSAISSLDDVSDERSMGTSESITSGSAGQGSNCLGEVYR